MTSPRSSTTPDKSETLAVGAGPRDLSGVTLGDFQVERLLGQGGMGAVYLALQISLNRPVALKVLRPDLLTNPTYLSRFESEAFAAAKLNHPNIVHVYAFGHHEDIRFLAMEYVEGTNLREYIIRKGPLELPLALSIMRQAGLAIGAAGEIGLVHRDIKPENLLLTRKGLVKVADFGLCRDQDPSSPHLTQPGVTMGTPLYMSPEQVQGHALDHRSDLYSLGVTFYHMLAGVPPFQGENALAVAVQHLKDKPVNLAVHRPDLPPELVRLVMKLMAKKPADRYPTAAEMLRDLARIRESLSTTQQATAAAPVSVTVAAPPAEAAKPAPPKVAVAQVVRGIWDHLPTARTWGIVAALALVVGGVCGWMGRSEDLLGPGAAVADGPPGLWMAPSWPQEVGRQRDAAAQYRYAQLAPGIDPLAAWLAVPGYFPGPGAHVWAFKAYAQLGRYLLRQQDDRRLELLATELGRSPRPEDKELAGLLRAAVWAIRDDPDAVIAELKEKKRDSLNPVLLPLCAEIARQAGRRPAAAAGGDTTELRKLEQRFTSRSLPAEAAEGGAGQTPLGASEQGMTAGSRPRSSVAWRF